jgi:hypothetical protein
MNGEKLLSKEGHREKFVTTPEGVAEARAKALANLEGDPEMRSKGAMYSLRNYLTDRVLETCYECGRFGMDEPHSGCPSAWHARINTQLTWLRNNWPPS